MKKSYEKILRRLVCYGLTLTMVLMPAFSVFAAEDGSEEHSSETAAVSESGTHESSQTQAQSAPASDNKEQSAPEPASYASPETTAEASAETAAVNAPEAGAAQNEGTDEAAEDIAEEETPSEPSGPDQSAEGSSTAEEKNYPLETSAPAQTSDNNTEISGTAPEDAASASGLIRIGDTSFSSGDDVESHWSDGKGWKNLASQYVAMVDYDGSEAEISADGGVVTLAVAGVNRIGKLKGNCSYQISGTGIVLIDSIDIEDGNTITLHPNSAVYNEGSAAVFLKQEDGNYLLINGDVTGILDDKYALDNVKLVIPEGSSLELGVLAVRKETWFDDEAEDFVTDVTLYNTDLPSGGSNAAHAGGDVDIEGFFGSVTLGKNSTLTIEEGASVKLKDIKVDFSSIEAELIVQGVLNVLGVLDGGFVDIKDGASVNGDGTVRSADIDLKPDGKISKKLTLENSGLSVNGDGDFTPPKLKNSIIYMKGSQVNIPELIASGVSRISVKTSGPLSYVSYGGSYTIGNITMEKGSTLEIVSNDHRVAPEYDGDMPRYVEDSFLTITGMITGGAVNVLAGCVSYTGEETDVLPSVPDAYASMAYITSSEKKYILNMTQKAAEYMAEDDKIPVMRMMVIDALISDDIHSRSWIIFSMDDLDPLNKEEQTFTCESFLNAYNITGKSSEIDYYTAVEVIYSDFSRQRFFMSDPTEFSTKDAIMIRVLDCFGQGGQGGSSITHTNASLTGSGIIGGPGSGSVKAGNGAVVFKKTASADPKPEPKPEPKPDPKPEPKPDPKPDENGNGNNDSGNNNSDNNNSNSSENNNNSSENNSSGNNDDINGNENSDDINGNNGESNGKNEENGENSNTGSKRSRVYRDYSVKAVSSEARSEGLVVTISVLEPKEEALKDHPDMPQIWNLGVTKDGAPVTDLSGNAVKVVIPFTLPESWGDPADIAEGSLYAVFADESGELTAYSAQYDQQTGEISFETEQTGDFVIVQFDSEEEEFSDAFYSALEQQEDIKLFLEVLKEKEE